jgi:hypothetical protein
MSNLPANCVPSTLQKLRPWVYMLATEDWRLHAEGQKCRGIRERKLAAWLRQQARLNVYASIHMQRQYKAQIKDIVRVLFATQSSEKVSEDLLTSKEQVCLTCSSKARVRAQESNAPEAACKTDRQSALFTKCKHRRARSSILCGGTLGASACWRSC